MIRMIEVNMKEMAKKYLETFPIYIYTLENDTHYDEDIFEFIQKFIAPALESNEILSEGGEKQLAEDLQAYLVKEAYLAVKDLYNGQCQEEIETTEKDSQLYPVEEENED